MEREKMSVPKSKRNQSELSVLTEADKLAIYTIRMCANERKFPKRYRWCITQGIVASAISVKKNVSMANAIYITDKESYILRRTYQQKALAELAGMMSDMDIAFRLFDGLKHTAETDKPNMEINISFWTGQALKTKNLLLAWKKSDVEKYKNMANR